MHGNSTPTSPHGWNPFRVFLIARLPPFKNASQNMYLFLLPLLLLLITLMDDISADNANKKPKKNNIQKLSLLRSFKHLLGRLHSHANCHNRKLHYDQRNRITLTSCLVSRQPCNVVNNVVYYLHNQPGRIGYEEIHRDTCRR